MALTDEQLLDFDVKALADLRRSPRELLAEHGDAYRQQLAMGRHFERWAWGAEEHRHSNPDQRFHAGFVEALRVIAAHCRQGDWLPGGAFYDEMNASGV
jgi:hypothetical protein